MGLQEGERPRGREGACGELGNLGGAKYFLSGPKCPPSYGDAQNRLVLADLVKNRKAQTKTITNFNTAGGGVLS